MNHIRKIIRLAVGSSAWLVTSSALAETGGVWGEGGRGGHHGRHAVPELDPATAAAALAVIVAAVLVFYGARKRT